jgi:hypothetical protein
VVAVSLYFILIPKPICDGWASLSPSEMTDQVNASTDPRLQIGNPLTH